VNKRTLYILYTQYDRSEQQQQCAD